MIFVRIGPRRFLAGCRKRQLNKTRISLVLLGLVFGVSCGFIFGFLVFILVVVGLFCQYHSQVIGWKDSSLKWPVMCQVGR